MTKTVKGAANGTAKGAVGGAVTGVVEEAARRRAQGRGVRRVRRDGSAADGRELLPLSKARDELDLDYDEFEVALQVGEVRTVVCGPGVWKVPRSELTRVRATRGYPETLLDRLRLVSSEGAAEAMGIGRDRFVRLARAGCVRPVRWYVNQYRAVVWLYLAREAAEFAAENRGVLAGRLPAALREAADGADQRARGWRARRTRQLVRDAADAWEEAAVWAALLGPEIAAEAVPDPCERARLHGLRTALPPGRPGRATPEQVRSITTADAPDEIAAGLVALAEALGRARTGQPVPRSSPSPVAAEAARPEEAVEEAARRFGPGPTRGPGRASVPRYVPDPSPVPDPVPVAVAGPVAAASPMRRGLRRLLGRRSPGGPARPGQSSPTSVSRITARPSSSEAARSTSAEMPQP
ncbi:DUF6397 family protein [Streptomyces sp. NPDC020917]|uniref:DUF6397 family protein n=1 Tax=Streptomyces sp. NPDC020917 TaxID=3365102 RepID=UPI0037A84429